MNLINKFLILSSSILLVGCALPQDVPSIPEPNVANPPTNTATTPKLTEDDAKAIALKEVPGGTIVEIESDLTDLSPNYDITIVDGTTEYDFEIDASSGAIKSIEKDLEINGEEVAPIITELEAKNIALKEASGGEITAISYEGDEYIPHYDISVKLGNYEYDFEIDARTGKITEIEKDLIS